MEFKGASILSISQFERNDIDRIFRVADRMEPYAQRQKITRVLEGAILGNMFFESSTRTRISFGSAFNLLGGEVRELYLLRPDRVRVKPSKTSTPEAYEYVLGGKVVFVVLRLWWHQGRPQRRQRQQK